MTFEELTQKLVDEGLAGFIDLRTGVLNGVSDGTCMTRNEDGTFNLSFCDERGVPFNEFYSIPESEACARVYSVANAKKRLYENEKKNNEGMSLH